MKEISELVYSQSPVCPPHPGDKGLKGIGTSETNLVLSAVADAESLKNHDILPMCA